MIIRTALSQDAPRIYELLLQVANVHASGRPDLFKKNHSKYTFQEVLELIQDDYNRIYVAIDENDTLIGYIFTVVEQEDDINSVFTNDKHLYIDDLCVDESIRSKGVGTALLNQAKLYAKEIGCTRLTLNAWLLNPSAITFYEKQGLVPYKISFESQIK